MRVHSNKELFEHNYWTNGVEVKGVVTHTKVKGRLSRVVGIATLWT